MKKRFLNLTIEAGATVRLPAFYMEPGRQFVEYNFASDQPLEAWIEYGRIQGTDNPDEAVENEDEDGEPVVGDTPGLRWDTPAAEIPAAERGQPVRWQLFASPDCGQLAVHNPGGTDATVSIDGGLS